MKHYVVERDWGDDNEVIGVFDSLDEAMSLAKEDSDFPWRNVSAWDGTVKEYIYDAYRAWVRA